MYVLKKISAYPLPKCRNRRPEISKFLFCLGVKKILVLEGLGDDAMGVQGSRARLAGMGVQGSRARLAGMLAGGVWFRVVHTAVIIPADVDASVVYSDVLGGVVRPL